MAQQPWNYSSLAEIRLDDAYLVEPPYSIRRQIERHIAPLSLKYNRLYRLSANTNRTGKGSLRLQTDSIDVTLPETLAALLFPYLVSDQYWRNRYRSLQEWAYVDMSNDILISVDTADHRYGQFSPVVWLGYRYQPSSEWPVVFTVRTNTHQRQQLTLPALMRLAEWGAFSTVEGLLALQQQQALRQQEEAERQEELQRHLDSLDRVSDLYARHADSITVVLQRDSLRYAEQRLLADVQAAKERMNRDQIFLLSVNPARSDYMFGLEFNFYNCYPKTITKVEITVTPVNDRGQVQRDQFNRDVRTIRCMGPIRPESPAQYTFDELFWDDRGRIKYMRVTSITFHFTDGTTKRFYGYEKILKHTLN